MLVNITKAAKLAGISRDTFYKNYINKGKVSTTKDHQNRPMVDTSEIMRVFGCLKDESPTDKEIQEVTLKNTPYLQPPTPPDTTAELARLQAENAQLKERLTETRETLIKREQEASERESWQRGQMEKLTDTIKLLEAPRPAPSTSFFARLFGLK